MIRTRLENIGGPFPGRGAAPSMAHDKILPRGQRAAFEALNDAAALRPSIMDAGSLVAANDNTVGYGAGGYACQCTECGKDFTGAKRSWRCEPCDKAATKNAIPLWTAKDLRLTPSQADFLSRGRSSVHQRVNDRTEVILKGRGMLAWIKGSSGVFHLGASPKGEAALKRYEKRGKSK